MWEIKAIGEDGIRFVQKALEIERAKLILHDIRMLGGDGFVVKVKL